MNMRQQAFVDNYLQNGGNATQAAIEAGYSPKTAKSIGQENLTKPDIQAAIEARNAELESARIADLQECLELLTAIARGEPMGATRTVDGENVEVRPTIALSLRAVEIRLKTLGAFIERHEIKTPTSQAILELDRKIREFSALAEG